MDCNFTVVSVLTYYSLVLLLGSVHSTRERFEEIIDQYQVNQQAVAYVKFTNTIRGKAEAAASRMKKNICSCVPKVKIAFCGRVLQVDYYGFEFDLQHYENSACIMQEFSFVSSTNLYSLLMLETIGSDALQLKMYACPTILYLDLETNEKILLPYKYHISRGRERKSAFVFFQDPDDNALHPQKYIRSISFKKLTSSIRTREETVETELKPTFLNPETFGDEDTLVRYMKTIQMIAPYSKFKNTYYSLNVCGLRRSHKINICRQIVENYEYVGVKIVHEEYDEEECKIHRILVRQRNENSKLFLLQCPPTAITLETEFMRSSLYYLASNAARNSVALFDQKNEKGQVPQLRFIVVGLNMRYIIEDIRRTNFMLYSPVTDEQRENRRHRKSYEEIEAEINSAAGGTVQTPNTIARNKELLLLVQQFSATNYALHLVLDQRLIEDSTISFSKIQKNTLVYSQFRATFWSIDICKLSDMQRWALCNDILSSDVYRLGTNQHNQKRDYKCTRRKTVFMLRDAENLKTDLFTMWECPPPQNDPQIAYYIGKSHLRDALLVFKSSDWSRRFPLRNTVFPDALVTRIYRYVFTNVDASNPYRIALSNLKETYYL